MVFCEYCLKILNNMKVGHQAVKGAGALTENKETRELG